MKNLRLLFCFVLQTCVFFAYPQNQPIQFDHIGTAEGLSQSTVLSILRDSRGFMWFGTRDGLNKYDGYKFTVYKTDPKDQNTLSNNYIMSIVESKKGDIWLATFGGGICRYDRNSERFTRYRHNPQDKNSLCDDAVNSIMEDSEGKLWIGTNAGLDMLDPANNKFEHFTNDPTNINSLSDSHVNSVFENGQHGLWICTMKGGINLFNRKNNSFTRFQHDKNDEGSIGCNNVFTMFEDSKHRLWLGTDGAGMDLFDPSTGKFKHFKHDENNPNSISANIVYAINEDTENNLWIGTESGGLSIFNYASGSFTTHTNDEIDRSSISNNSVYSIYRDPKNNMWLGNVTEGIDLANREKRKFAHFRHMFKKNSLSKNQVWSIIEDTKKNIWIGTDGGGLNLFDPVRNNFTHFRHEKNNEQSICGDFVLTLCEDSKGNIWIGTFAEGITVFDPISNTFKHFRNHPANTSSLSSNNVMSIYEDKDKNIWIGTYAGLDLFNPASGSFTHYQYDKNRMDGISGNLVVAILEGSDGQLWVGTEGGGLNLFNKETNSFSRFLQDDTKNSISDNMLSCLWEDSNKNLWIGTRMGLSQYNKKTNLFKVYTIADGLPGNIILGFLEDGKKNLWVSTNNGLSCFNPQAKTFKNYSVADGLQSNEFNDQAYCKSSSGMMYFGGINGFNQFFPDSIVTIAFDPPLVITNFKIFNKEVSVAIGANDPSPLVRSITETKAIELPYSNTVFSFEFATLNYTAAEKKQYQYMLENFDKNWNEAGTSRMATYTNLDPGEYIFKVRGLNNEGKWSSDITSIHLTIQPPFWLTWWFKLAGIFFVIAGISTFYRFRMKDIKAQKARLQQQVHEQTLQLVLSAAEEHEAREEAEKARIETDLVNEELKVQNKETEYARMETELANKELKIKNAELEQFAYVASHDLQEPLRTTSGFVKLLQQQYRGKLDEKADKYLDFISESTDRMKVLIKDLLDFSKIGAKVKLESVDCNIILNNVLADITTAILEAKADIQYDKLPVINGYPTEIKLLFQNLIINAIKFRKKGTAPQINISVNKKEGYWEFTFADNGIGIEKKYNERIFDMFQRLHTHAQYTGSGIGLSHCKKIVELHHGKIWVESSVGQGSVFYFTIPEKNI